MNTMRPIRKGRVAACKVIPTSISAKNWKLQLYLQAEIDLMMNI
jgi:hypothetical protein